MNIDAFEGERRLDATLLPNFQHHQSRITDQSVFLANTVHQSIIDKYNPIGEGKRFREAYEQHKISEDSITDVVVNHDFADLLAKQRQKAAGSAGYLYGVLIGCYVTANMTESFAYLFTGVLATGFAGEVLGRRRAKKAHGSELEKGL